MSEQSSIEWLARFDPGGRVLARGTTWNPWTGCREVSAGCDNCYARVFAERFRGVPGHPFEHGFDLTLHLERLGKPFTWKKPRRVFVDSMSDFLHKDIDDQYIQCLFAVMCLAPQHTYLLLTKRPSRLKNTALMGKLADLFELYTGQRHWPSHIQVGVSVENQLNTWRIAALRRAFGGWDIPTEGVVLFISGEPLLGPLSPTTDLSGFSWLIAGAESGHGARPCQEDWVRGLRDMASAQGLAFFYKQAADEHGHKLPLPMLDGQRWTEYPDAAHRVQEGGAA